MTMGDHKPHVPNEMPEGGLPQDGPVISLGCGHTYRPNHIQGDRRVTCLECDHRPTFAVKAEAPTHIVYRVRRTP